MASAKPAKVKVSRKSAYGGDAPSQKSSGERPARERRHPGVEIYQKGPLRRVERRAEGRALRTRVPRTSHGSWTPAPDRPDPIAILEQQAESREPELIPIRHGRMISSPFAYYRGAAAMMAADLASTPQTDICVQACGDAHLMNFGLFGTPERHLIFDVNDFDETIPGPWEWDVKRLAASLAVAARENGFSSDAAADIVREGVLSYRMRMAQLSTMHTMDVWYSKVDVDDLMHLFREMSAHNSRGRENLRGPEKTVARARAHDTQQAVAKLTEVTDGRRRIVDNPPLVDHVGLAEAEDQVRVLYEGYLDTLSPEMEHLMSRFRVADVARKVVGVGSVGTRCWIVLMEGGGEDDPLFLQVKEAQTSVLQPYLNGSSIFRHPGERVVHGQRMMQAASDLFLGWSTNPATGIHYYFRQLHDMKGSADVPALNPSQLGTYAAICGWSLARAHARGGDAAMISGYLGNTDTFDQAISRFASSYADQNERDFETLVAAVRQGRIEAIEGL